MKQQSNTHAFITTVLPQDEHLKAAVSIQNNYVTHGWGDGSAAHMDGFAAKADPSSQLYFALSTYQTQSRKAENAGNIKSFWLDLDAGAAKFARHGDKVYETQQAAIVDLYGFCGAASFPQPSYVVSSGTGLHVYWALDTHIPATQWLPIAKHFKVVLDAYGVRQDHARTADISSVLRIPGTLNLNMVTTQTDEDDQTFEREVRIIGGGLYGHDSKPGNTYALSEFTDALAATGVEAPVEQSTPRANTDKPIPASYFKNIVIKTQQGTGCNQLAELISSGGCVEEPLWRAGLSVVQSCMDSDADKDYAMRLVSDAHPGFSIEETQKKAWGTRGAQSCIQFENLNPNGCRGCRYQNSDVTSPRQLGYSDEPSGKENMAALKAGAAPVHANPLSLPVVGLGDMAVAEAVTGDTREKDSSKNHFVNKDQGIMFTDAMTGIEYRLGMWISDGRGDFMLKGGATSQFGVTMIKHEKPKKREPGEATGEDDDIVGRVARVILPQSVYMVDRMGTSFAGEGKERCVMVVEAPNKKPEMLELTFGQIAATGEKLTAVLANGLGCATSDASTGPLIGSYFLAWRNHLASIRSLTKVTIPTGWDGDDFMFANFSHGPKGKKAVPQHHTATAMIPKVDEPSTVAGWTEATMKLYPNGVKGIEAYQFMTLTQLGASMLSKVVSDVERGGVVHFYSEETAAGKSSAIHRAISAFTNPDKMSVPASTNLGTVLVKASHLNSFGLYIDEWTDEDAKKQGDLAMAMCAGRQKARQKQGGGDMQSDENQSWRAFAITTANNSLLDIIKTAKGRQGVEASQHRVLELEVLPISWAPEHAHLTTAHTGALTDVWLARLTENRDWEARFAAFKIQFRLDSGMTTKERIRLNGAAGILFAGELSYEMGLHRYDMAAMRKWLIAEIQKVQSDAKTTKQSPGSIVSAYIAAHTSATIFSQADKLFTSDLKGNQVLVRTYEKDNVIIVVESPFRKWCAANNHNVRGMIRELGPKMKPSMANVMKGIIGAPTHPVHVIKFTGLGIPVLQDQQPTEEKEENV